MQTLSSTAHRGLLDNTLGLSSLLAFVILGLTWLAGFMCRLFAVIRYTVFSSFLNFFHFWYASFICRFESIIHEFDPWFNYRATYYMTENGFYPFLNWFDDRAWYPLGRIVGGTVYPGLMLTSGILWLFQILFTFLSILKIITFLSILNLLTLIQPHFNVQGQFIGCWTHCTFRCIFEKSASFSHLFSQASRRLQPIS